MCVVLLTANDEVICKPLPPWRLFYKEIEEGITQPAREAMTKIDKQFGHRFGNRLGHILGRGGYRMPNWSI